ncbi:MAG: rfbC [Amycolatopsis sp.]|uniref:dTDP-4-dehydrorhamnose 3,5-epimerase family protein n=1 Tax=Amycolatopsis sp. TaxID=37632 RepID=UPI002623A509|nr:dTDP-4-dehydrorhamnose 3,5-epimerase [Amycolatopsis sp.]MCU1680499.1 rfbC [Amycolatopsis sp.]
MKSSELAISGAFEFVPTTFADNRGMFVSPYQAPALIEAIGYAMPVVQTNHSISRRGSIRGVHFADVPPSQAKFIYCPRGSLLDVVVDIRVGSPTFGKWDAVRLDSKECRGLYVSEGLGHSFVALEDDTVMTYLCSEGYNPGAEHGINPLDPALGLPWPADLEQLLSDKDRDAPTLAEAEAAGTLPRYEDCLAYYDQLRAAHA